MNTLNPRLDMHLTEESRIIIDEKLKVLEDQKLELRRARNKLSTVNSHLPVELLANIFRYVVPTRSNGTCILHICDSRNSVCREWVPVIAHVCNHWRAVALSTPSLWVNCIPPSPNAVKVYLDRSAGLPIVLDIAFWKLSWESTQLLLTRLPTAQGFRLHLLPSYGARENTRDIKQARKKFVQSLGNLPQSLQHLTIHGIWHESGEEVHIIPCLTAKINKNQFPNLRHLYLSQTMVDWNCGLLHNLHTLVLRELRYGLLPISQMLEILKACPDIERLELSDIHWMNDVTTNASHEERLFLRCLRSALVNTASFDVTVAILHRVSFPEGANVWIDLDIPEEISKMIIPPIFLVALLILQQSGKPLGRLGISCREEHAGIFGSILGSTGTLCLNVGTWNGTRGEALQIVDNVLLVADRNLSSLVELEIQLDGTQTASEKWWSKLFSRMPELRVLSLQSTHRMISALKALQNAAPTASRKSKRKTADTSIILADSNSTPIPLPHLKELFLCNRDFMGMCFVDLDHQREILEDPSCPIHHLRKCLETRRNHDFRLEQLTLRTYTPADAPSLKFLSDSELVQRIVVHDPPFDWSSAFLLHSRFMWDWRIES